MDVVIETLVIEVDREEHIVKHNVTIAEVEGIISGDYLYVKGKLNRWLLVGQTNKARFLTVIVGKRKPKNTYGLVTARDSKKKEKSLYIEYLKQKEDDYEN